MNKKFLLLVAVLAAFATAAFAQPRAIGARVGYGIGVSYQHGFGEENMLTAELGYAGPQSGMDGMDLGITYDWVFPIRSWQEKGSWDWYAGVGLAGGFYHKSVLTESATLGWVGPTGRIGVEYKFWFPLQIGIEWRPSLAPEIVTISEDGVGSTGTDFFAEGLYQTAFTLNIRYCF